MIQSSTSAHLEILKHNAMQLPEHHLRHAFQHRLELGIQAPSNARRAGWNSPFESLRAFSISPWPLPLATTSSSAANFIRFADMPAFSARSATSLSNSTVFGAAATALPRGRAAALPAALLADGPSERVFFAGGVVTSADALELRLPAFFAPLDSAAAGFSAAGGE